MHTVGYIKLQITKCSKNLEMIAYTYSSSSQREGLRSATRMRQLYIFLEKKYIHSCSFYLSGYVNKVLNFCVVYFIVGF